MKSRSRKSQKLASSLLVSSVLISSLISGLTSFSMPVSAQEASEGDGNMDSMWDDKGGDKSADKGAGQGGGTQTIPTPGKGLLCTVSTFKDSELVKTSCWPGVGPFKDDSEGQALSDPQDNKLRLITSGDKLTAAELLLVGQKQDPQGILNLQMVTAFMLEALGAKNKNIAEFNTFVEKNKASLAAQGRDQAVIRTTSGPYVVSLRSTAAGGGPAFLIEVLSKGVSEEEVKSHSVASLYAGSNTNANAGDEQENTPPPVKTTPAPVKTTVTPVKSTPAPAKTTPVKVATTANTTSSAPLSNLSKSTQQAIKQASAGETTSSPAGEGEGLKKELGDVIRNWQSIKKIAVKEKQTGELNSILSGRALAKQTHAVNWLTTQKQFYELTPRGVTVDKVEKLSQTPPRYAVYVKVKELSKLMEDGTNRVIKESEDTYSVNYTVEKISGHWSIENSQIVQKK